MNKNVYALFVCMILALGHSVQAQLTEEVKKKTPELPGQIMADFGFNAVVDNPAVLPYHWWRSKSLGIYFVKPYDFMNKFEFRPGIGLNFEKFGHADNMQVFAYGEDIDGTDSLGFSTVLGGSLKKNQLAVTYIDVPVEVRYNFSGNEDKDGFFIAVGGSAAIRLESHTKLKYTDEFGNKRKTKDKNVFGLNGIRLGAYGRVGYRSLSLFYKTYFTNMFGSSGPIGTGDMLYSTIGISLTGL